MLNCPMLCRYAFVRICSSLLLSGFGLLQSGQAFARNPGKIKVWVLPVKVEGERFKDLRPYLGLVRGALRETGRVNEVELRKLTGPFSPPAPCPGPEIMAGYYGQVERGRTEYLYHRSADGALRILAPAAAGIWKLLPCIKFRTKALSWLKLAELTRIQILLSQNKGAPAGRIAERLLKANPGLTLSSAKFQPSLRRYLLRVKRRLRARGMGLLTIETRPRGARLFLNGFPLGQGPVSLKPMPHGQYQVQALSGGRLSRLHEVNLAVKARVAIDIALDNALLRKGGELWLAFEQDPGGDVIERFARELAGKAGLQGLVTLRVEIARGRWLLKGALFHQGQGRPNRAVVKIPSPPALSMKAARKLTRKLLGLPQKKTVLPPTSPEGLKGLGAAPPSRAGRGAGAVGRPWYRRWWLWTLAALAVGGGISAALLLKRKQYETSVLLTH